MLTFPLKKEWYEKIKSGEKTVEYREVKPYWTSRVDKEFHLELDECRRVGEAIIFVTQRPACKLRLGYTNKYLTANITKIEIVDGKDTYLAVDKPVYAIHLADVKENENA